MNDRYLYRAKRKKDGKWTTWNAVTGIHGLERIEDDTICQCTGLKDKNGKLIWENDICRRILLPTKRIKTIFRIAYVPYKCCLSAIDLDGSNITFLSDYINNQYEVEVIGNIFDGGSENIGK